MTPHVLPSSARVISPRVVRRSEMRAIEAAAIAADVDEQQLQRNAARALADLAPLLGRGPSDGTVVVLVGPGNNGRDAMLAGRHLARRGYTVTMVVGPKHAVLESELEELKQLRVRLALSAEDPIEAHQTLERGLTSAALALDGLLGIGSRGALRDPLDQFARTLNLARKQVGERLQVLAVDLPSGVDADTGEVFGVAVQADITAALGAVKAGTLRFPGAHYSGEIVCLSIGLPASINLAELPSLLDWVEVAPLVPPRPRSGHKGTFGKLLVIGGSSAYLGAPLLTALAAARSGCGLVALAVPPAIQQAAATVVPEATCIGPIDVERATDEAIACVLTSLHAFDALVLGPGLGRGAGAAALVRSVLAAEGIVGVPAVVDADALNVLAGWDRWPSQTHARMVLTPHHGEMGRLVGVGHDQIAKENWELAAERSVAWDHIVVLKGPHTSVSDPKHGTRVLAQSNPALATAGSGDVLCGLIGGLMAQGLGRWDAARLGVLTHSQAALRALRHESRRSLIASDLSAEIPIVLASLARGEATSD